MVVTPPKTHEASAMSAPPKMIIVTHPVLTFFSNPTKARPSKTAPMYRITTARIIPPAI